MSWHRGRIFAFDLETTSADPEEARIVTAAVIAVGGGEPMMAATWLADPGVEIPDGAAAIHGVTTERAQAEGAPVAQVAGEVIAALCRTISLGLPLVIYNARYDLTVLDREAARYGLSMPSGWLVVDPLVIDKHLDRYRKGSRKLDAVCAHHDATLDGAHDAGADALAAARLAYRLAERGQVIRRARDAAEGEELDALRREWDRVRHDLPALHRAQVGWAREQAEGLAAHFRQKGQAETVRTEWPMVPPVEMQLEGMA